VSAPPLAERLAAVQAAVEETARMAGRSPDEVTTIVVTKFHPASLIRELFDLGVREFGENKHQEASAKAVDLADLDLRWNFVGQLQSNKARAVRGYAHAIHSVDRPSVVRALEADESIDVFLQVNLTEDPARGGVQPADLPELARRALEARGLRLRGLMAVAPLGAEPRAAFARVRELSEQLHDIAPEATALSMGMSGDFREAILEGATHLRVGAAITGNRPPRG
jgi:pyridoxal phosphate enzyme (YggS family)